MSTKLFVTADVHGHYTELMKALNEAGFDEDNPSLWGYGVRSARVYILD